MSQIKCLNYQLNKTLNKIDYVTLKINFTYILEIYYKS